jgi:8-oxo-dGTP pyrophosphatase MutT (NUDIX family)
MSEDYDVTLTPIGNGISRVDFPAHLPMDAFDEMMPRVRAEVERALGDLKQVRVEAHVAPDDKVGHRIATWAGLHREGLRRGTGVDESDQPVHRLVFARISTDAPVTDPEGFRGLLNSFLPRKRAIAQLLVRDHDGRVLLCQLTYKQDWDLPGGVVEVGESPQLAVSREVEEELDLTIKAGALLLTDWLPPWSGWDDAVCLVFDGGEHDPSLLHDVVREEREIQRAEFCTLEQVEARCAEFTARRVRAALASAHGDGTSYTESGRPTGG